MRLLLIQKTGVLTEAALLEDRKLVDCRKEIEGGIAAEQLYAGVVERVVSGMNAAFVRLTNRENGFLPLSEAKQKPKAGDTVLVQVKKPPVQQKAAYLTQDIALAADTVILLPASSFCSVSQKMDDAQERAALLNKAKALAPSGMGLVMRSAALNASEEALQTAVQTLVTRWQRIQDILPTLRPPCPIPQEMSLAERFLRDCEAAGETIDGVIVNDEVLCPARLRAVSRVAEHPFDLYGVREQLRKALSRRVWLKSGGFLVIDPCEALTVIDVNSGKFTGGKSGSEETFFKTNLEAVSEIARLMRLRGMGGIVLADFIDMASEAHREALLSAMRNALKHDPVKCVVHGFTSLGLLEMTRKKMSEALQAEHSMLCPLCGGTGIRQEEATK